VWTVEEVRQESEVPDSMGIRRAKPETSKGQKEVNYTPGLTEWLVSTLLLVSAEEFSDDRPRLHVETLLLTNFLDDRQVRPTC
jgi:hypothetical protein